MVVIEETERQGSLWCIKGVSANEYCPPRSLVEVHRYFGGIDSLHLQGEALS
jgi:hypothetical protein